MVINRAIAATTPFALPRGSHSRAIGARYSYTHRRVWTPLASRSESDAPTTYRVVVDGRYVDSYLTKAQARSAAQAIVDRAELAAIHTTSGSCLAA